MSSLNLSLSFVPHRTAAVTDASSAESSSSPSLSTLSPADLEAIVSQFQLFSCDSTSTKPSESPYEKEFSLHESGAKVAN